MSVLHISCSKAIFINVSYKYVRNEILLKKVFETLEESRKNPNTSLLACNVNVFAKVQIFQESTKKSSPIIFVLLTIQSFKK